MLPVVTGLVIWPHSGLNPRRSSDQIYHAAMKKECMRVGSVWRFLLPLLSWRLELLPACFQPPVWREPSHERLWSRIPQADPSDPGWPEPHEKFLSNRQTVIFTISDGWFLSNKIIWWIGVCVIEQACRDPHALSQQRLCEPPAVALV